MGILLTVLLLVSVLFNIRLLYHLKYVRKDRDDWEHLYKLAMNREGRNNG